jgi:hypothetical protein
MFVFSVELSLAWTSFLSSVWYVDMIDYLNTALHVSRGEEGGNVMDCFCRVWLSAAGFIVTFGKGPGHGL